MSIHTWGGGTRSQIFFGGGYQVSDFLGGGVPGLRFFWGGYQVSHFGGGGYLVSVKGKLFDTRFGLIHVQTWKNTFVKGPPPPPPPPPGIARNCYGYTAGGMPLAFTQEDFLVAKMFRMRVCLCIFQHWVTLTIAVTFHNKCKLAGILNRTLAFVLRFATAYRSNQCAQLTRKYSWLCDTRLIVPMWKYTGCRDVYCDRRYGYWRRNIWRLTCDASGRKLTRCLIPLASNDQPTVNVVFTLNAVKLVIPRDEILS